MKEIIAWIQGSPYLLASTWLVGSLIVAFLVHVVTTKLLPRLTGKTRTDLDDRVLHALGKPLFGTVVLVGASFAILPLEPGETFVFVADGVLITLGVLIWIGGLRRIISMLLNSASQRLGGRGIVQPRTLPLFDIGAKALLFGGAAYGILLAWKVDVTAWLASAGILGIAIGFAAKDTLANLFSGIFILADAPYKIGDFIVLGSGERGQVTDIGIRSTRILTRDDIEIIMPNAAIANSKIVNENGGHHVKERVRVTVGVAYGSDIDRVRAALMDVAAASEYLAEDPAPRVRFREFADSALTFQLMGWIDEPVLRGRALDALNSAVYKRFAEDEIEIAFPQLDVHLKSQPAAEADHSRSSTSQ